MTLRGSSAGIETGNTLEAESLIARPTGTIASDDPHSPNQHISSTNTGCGTFLMP